MELYIYTGAPDKSQAVATSAADLALLVAALADPTAGDNPATLARIAQSIPQLGLNNDEPLTLRFYSSATTEESWPAVVGNSVSVGLGLLTPDGTQALVSTTADTIVSTYRTGTLTLTTAALKNYLGGYARRGFVTLWLHVRRTAVTTGARTTQVLMPVQVSDAVLNSATTAPDSSTTYYTAAESDARYQPADSLAGEFLLKDDFSRADTAAGVLGSPNIGNAWDMRGGYVASFPLPAATVGQIINGVFTAPENTPRVVTYATQLFAQTPRRLGLSASWAAGTGSASAAVVLAWSTTSDFISTMIHCYFNQTEAVFQVREAGGAFVSLITYSYDTAIPADGTVAHFEVEINGTTAVMVLSHPAFGTKRVAYTDTRIGTCAGPYCFWEIFHNDTTVVGIPSIRSVWAVPTSASTPPRLVQDRVTQLASPSTGATVSMTNDSRDGTYAASLSGPLDALTVNLPGAVNSILGQRRTFTTTHAIKAITFASTGGTFGGTAVASLAAGESVTFEKINSTVWLPVGRGLESPSNRAVTFASPNAGDTLTMTQDARDGTLALAPGGTLATLTVNLPSNTVSLTGQRRTIATTQAITAITIQATGITMLGNVTTLAAGAAVTFEKVSNGYWQRVG
jgi:hypothetical protein